MARVRAGRLNRRIALQTPVETRDPETKEPEKSWLGGDLRWASIVPLSGRELFQAQQVRPQISHKVNIRYRKGVTSKMRVLLDSSALEIETTLDMPDDERRKMFGSRVLEIDSWIDLEEQRRNMQLMCKDGQYGVTA